MKEDTIKMIYEAADKDKVDPISNGFVVLTEREFERFAALVAAAEREACAAIARKWDVDHPTTNYGGCIANEIIARGQA